MGQGRDIYLWGEGFVGVEVVWVGDCPVVGLVDDVAKEGDGGRSIDARWGLSP